MSSSRQLPELDAHQIDDIIHSFQHCRTTEFTFNLKNYAITDDHSLQRLYADILLEDQKKSVCLDFSGSDMTMGALEDLIKFIGLCPTGTTINLNISQITSRPQSQTAADTLAQKFITGIINNRNFGLHLTLPAHFFRFFPHTLEKFYFYKMIRECQCLETLILLPEEKRIARLKKDEIAKALLSNPYLLHLEIPENYYLPDEHKTPQVPIHLLIERNKKFRRDKKEIINLLIMPTVLLDIIIDYLIDGPLASEAEKNLMANVALQEFSPEKSEETIKNNAKTFFIIYHRYKDPCRIAFQQNDAFKNMLRLHLRRFLLLLQRDIQERPYIDQSLVDPSINGSLILAAQKKFFLSEAAFFIKLLAITQVELERDMVLIREAEYFLPSEPYVTSEDITQLKTNCVDPDTKTVQLTSNQDFEKILTLDEGTIVRISKHNYDEKKSPLSFDPQSSQDFCRLLEQGPKKLTVVIASRYAGICFLIEALAGLIEKGNYPKGLFLILRGTNEPHMVYSIHQEKLLTALRSSVEKPELHLALPYHLLSSPLLTEAIIHNQFLKTFILTEYNFLPKNLMMALEINDTLDLFDVPHSTSFFTRFSIRNQQFKEKKLDVHYLRMPIILMDHFASAVTEEKETKEEEEEEEAKADESATLFFFACCRFQDNITVLLLGPFLSFFQEHVVFFLKKLARAYSPLVPPETGLFIKLATNLIKMGKITHAQLKIDDEILHPSFASEMPTIRKQLYEQCAPPTLLIASPPIEEAKDDHPTTDKPAPMGPVDQGLDAVYQSTRENVQKGTRTLQQALNSSFMPNDHFIDAATLTAFINEYHLEKGKLRRLFNSCTKTIHALRNLANQAERLGKNISAFQIELCLMERDLRRATFRSGILCRSVTFFKTGDIGGCQKKKDRNKGRENFSATEKLIEKLSKVYLNPRKP